MLLHPDLQGPVHVVVGVLVIALFCVLFNLSCGSNQSRWLVSFVGFGNVEDLDQELQLFLVQVLLLSSSSSLLLLPDPQIPPPFVGFVHYSY